MDILEEQLQVVLGNWSQEPFSFGGRHYTLRELNAQPKPIQRPHPPLIIGGRAGPRSAALAARYGDEYNTAFATPDDVRERKARIDQACERAGREPIPFSVMTGVIVGADPGQVRDRVARVAGLQGADANALLANPPRGLVVGTVEEAVEQLAALREAGVSRVMCQQLLHDDLEAVALLGEELAARLA
jgi:alkanesulfonate monooxygenase SsuD/methylene tetrahydromethanopterin reductase-like flavin-dependent oxidoreductase (luciferase family)